MLNLNKLALKISRLTMLPKNEVDTVLGHIFAELLKAFESDQSYFLLLGRPEHSDEFLANPKAYSGRHRVVLATKQSLGN